MRQGQGPLAVAVDGSLGREQRRGLGRSSEFSRNGDRSQGLDGRAGSFKARR